MKTIKFKSNIKCNGCIAAINDKMNELVGENKWQVDLNSEDRILTVENDDISAKDVSEELSKLGYLAEEI